MWELLRRNPKFIAGSIIVGIFVIIGVIGPMVTRDPLKGCKVIVPQGMDLGNTQPSEFGNWTFQAMPPGTYTIIEETTYIVQFENGTQRPVTETKVYDVTFILGTTQYGMDMFAQLCTGIRNSLFVGVIGGVLGTLIAVLLGALGAYRGGLVDETSNAITNIVMVFPTLPALLVLASLLEPRYFKFSLPIIGRIEGRSFLTVGVIIALTSWPWAARCIRSQVLSLKEREFISLAKMSGMRSREIVIKDVLPNMLAYILMVFVLLTGGAMLAESWLSVLGLGPNPTEHVTLGNIMHNCRASSLGNWWTFWWWWIPPGAVLAALLSVIFVMHAGMDEVFNPRLRRM
ncbi:MAG: ABC transporter permease [Candidatus Bathyarchaeia archaeon]